MFDIKKRIAGSEGTNNYAVIAEGRNGLVAVRLVGGSTFRVRVEPSSAAGASSMATRLTRAADWKQPGDQGQNRFSTVCDGGAELRLAVDEAIKALDCDDSAADFDGALAAIVMVGSTDRSTLIERVRAAKLPGASAAVNWTTTTLVAKLAAGPEDEKAALADRLKAGKVAGANLARTWALAVLRRKVLALA